MAALSKWGRQLLLHIKQGNLGKPSMNKHPTYTCHNDTAKDTKQHLDLTWQQIFGIYYQCTPRFKIIFFQICINILHISISQQPFFQNFKNLGKSDRKPFNVMSSQKRNRFEYTQHFMLRFHALISVTGWCIAQIFCQLPRLECRLDHCLD